MTTPAAGHEGTPQRVLGILDAIGIIVGLVIGAGIFRCPPLVAGNSSARAAFYLLWIAGGVISLIGALCYAELATAYPNAGGDYHFIQRAFGRSLSFLFAWARIAVITTGAIAVLGYTFGDYASNLLRLGAELVGDLRRARGARAHRDQHRRHPRDEGHAERAHRRSRSLGVVAVIVTGILLVAPAAARGGAGRGEVVDGRRAARDAVHPVHLRRMERGARTSPPS